jgi:hypothetical protein
LFKLRTGHNRLKAKLARFNNQLDSTCQFCEDEDESIKHVLLECPALELERQEINSYFTTHNMEHNLCNLLGLNPRNNSNTQHEVQRLLIQFLKATKHINTIKIKT